MFTLLNGALVWPSAAVGSRFSWFKLPILPGIRSIAFSLRMLYLDRHPYTPVRLSLALQNSRRDSMPYKWDPTANYWTARIQGSNYHCTPTPLWKGSWCKFFPYGEDLFSQRELFFPYGVNLVSKEIKLCPLKVYLSCQKPGSITQSVARLTADPWVSCSYPSRPHTYRWDWSWNHFVRLFYSLSGWVKRDSRQLLAKLCAHVLVNLLEELACPGKVWVG